MPGERPDGDEHTYRRWRLALVVIGTLVASSYLLAELYQGLGRFGDVISLYFGAWVLRFLLAPPVDWLCKHGWGRGLAAIVVYLAVGLGLAGLLVWALPIFVTQAIDLAGSKLPQVRLRDVPTTAAQLQQLVREHAPKEAQGTLIAWIHDYSTQIQAQLNDLSRNVLNGLQPLTLNVTRNTVSAVRNTLSLLFTAFIVLLLSFFMMVQGGEAWQGIHSRIPSSLDPDVAALESVIERAFGGFVRGQLVLSTVYAVLIFAVLQVFARVAGSGDLASFAVVAAILAGLIMIIPAIGTTLSILPAVLIGVLALHDWGRSLWLLLIIWVVQFVMANIVGPRVMSQSVGINPVWSFAGLLVGAKLGGLLGAFFGVPLLAVLLAVLDLLYRHLADDGRPAASAHAGAGASSEPAPPRPGALARLWQRRRRAGGERG